MNINTGITNGAHGRGSQSTVVDAGAVVSTWGHACATSVAADGGASPCRWHTSVGLPTRRALPMGHSKCWPIWHYGARDPAQHGAIRPLKSLTRIPVYTSDRAFALSRAASNSDANARHCPRERLPSHSVMILQWQPIFWRGRCPRCLAWVVSEVFGVGGVRGVWRGWCPRCLNVGRVRGVRRGSCLRCLIWVVSEGFDMGRVRGV